MKSYKEQLDKYNDEQELFLKEQEFKIEEENRLKGKISKRIKYEKNIKDFQEKVREKRLY